MESNKPPKRVGGSMPEQPLEHTEPGLGQGHSKKDISMLMPLTKGNHLASRKGQEHAMFKAVKLYESFEVR